MASPPYSLHARAEDPALHDLQTARGRSCARFSGPACGTLITFHDSILACLWRRHARCEGCTVSLPRLYTPPRVFLCPTGPQQPTPPKMVPFHPLSRRVRLDLCPKICRHTKRADPCHRLAGNEGCFGVRFPAYPLTCIATCVSISFYVITQLMYSSQRLPRGYH